MISEFVLKHRIISDATFLPEVFVMMIDATRKSKWDPAYEGPFTVVRRNKGERTFLRIEWAKHLSVLCRLIS